MSQGYNPEGHDENYDDQFARIDLSWMERIMFGEEEDPRLQNPAYPRSAFWIDYTGCDVLIVIGESDVLDPEMVKPPFVASVRIPKQSEIFRMARSYRNTEKSKWKLGFAERFSLDQRRGSSSNPVARATGV
jgi:hypothetical protein